MGCTAEGITWAGFHGVLYEVEYREGQAEIDLSKCNGTCVSSSSSSSDEGDEDSGDDELAAALALSMRDAGHGVTDTAAVAELVSWGFDESAVRSALEAAGGDKEAAANMLLG